MLRTQPGTRFPSLGACGCGPGTVSALTLQSPSLLAQTFLVSDINWIFLCRAWGQAATFWAPPIPNQVLSSVGSLRGLGDIHSCHSSWPFKEGRKQLSGLGIASAGAWRVPGEGGAGWWLISLVPCENSHPSLLAPQLQPPPPGSGSPSPIDSPYRTPRALPWRTPCTPAHILGPGQRGVGKCLLHWLFADLGCSTLLTMGVSPLSVWLTRAWGGRGLYFSYAGILLTQGRDAFYTGLSLTTGLPSALGFC